LKLAGIAVAILLGFAILGEFSASEIATVRVMMRGRSPSEPTPGEVS
jgi:hypothetical protein